MAPHAPPLVTIAGEVYEKNREREPLEAQPGLYPGGVEGVATSPLLSVATFTEKSKHNMIYHE